MNVGTTWRWVAVALISALESLSSAAQTLDSSVVRQPIDYPSLKLPFYDRMARWGQIGIGEDRDEAFALGESLVQEATQLHERVWIPSLLAEFYVDAGRFDRANQLIQQADEVAGKFFFRVMSDSGEKGEWKSFALFHLNQAKCVLGKASYRFEAAEVACTQAIEYADIAWRLAPASARNLPDAESDRVLARVNEAQADLAGGRVQSAQATIIGALALAGPSTAISTRSLMFLAASDIGLQLGDYEGAIEMAKRSITVFDERGLNYVSPTYGRIWGRSALQRALVVAGRWDKAREEFDDVDRATSGNSVTASAARNILARSLVYAHSGELHRLSKELERRAVGLSRRIGPDQLQVALLVGLLGGAQMESEDAEVRALALPNLRRAARVLIDARPGSETGGEGGIADAVTRFVLARYLVLSSAKSSSQAADLDLGFQVAEKLRNSSVQAAIEDAAVRSAASVSGLGDLMRREQDVRGETQALVQAMARVSTREGADDTQASLESQRARVTGLLVLRQRLDAELKQRFPDFANLIQPASATVSDVSALLDENKAYVSLVPIDDGVYVSVVDSRGASTRLLAIGRNTLEGLVAEIRKSTDLDRTEGDAAPFPGGAAQSLFTLLFAPFRDQLQAKQHLVIAPAGVLAALPFGVLLTDAWDGRDAASAPWLIRRWTLSQVPSANALRALKRFGGTDHAGEPLLAWGDPTFNRHAQAVPGGIRKVSITRTRPDLNVTDARAALLYDQIPALPDTREELLAIAATLRANAGEDVRLGEQATRASVLAASASGALARKRVIAFATHGLMAGDLPDLDQPALALAATGHEDKEPLAPLLTLEDVLKLKLNADWVVLSACNTAAADGKASEALSGLARGFFYAGARSLLVTQWAVETESAKLLTTGTFEYLAAHPDASKAESLRQAMLKVMALRDFGHPAFWAPYVLVGDGGR